MVLGAALFSLSVAPACSSSRFTRPLPAYAGASATLFDDSVEPSAIGLDFDQSFDPMKDSAFRQRLHEADGVVPFHAGEMLAWKLA